MNSGDEFADLDQLFGSNRDDKGYFEWNREDVNALYIDEKENAIDSLETAIQFLDRDDNLKWKWIAFSLHHSLYSFCISALEKGNYDIVTRKWGNDKNIFICDVNGFRVKRSNKVKYFIGAYETPAYRIEWENIIPSEPSPDRTTYTKESKDDEDLIGFWTALARVQDQYYWMGRQIGIKAVSISEEELKEIVWLSEYVRNELMHFVPKGYSIGIKRILIAAQIIVEKIDFLVFKSHSILFVEYESSTKRIRAAIDQIKGKLEIELNYLSKKEK